MQNSITNVYFDSDYDQLGYNEKQGTTMSK